ncbi:hypothetical protein [Bremerella cremea]|uniref:hypothetical protein n=1 Tax=Bremerella cremea TaxID=1031537 RepID=UPI0031EE14E2
MSTDAQSSLNNAEPIASKTTSQDFIRRKINSTRRSVKLAELAAGLLLFIAGSLLFVLTLAIIDHWIVGLNFTARLLAFLVYILAAAGFLWIYVAPLLFHSINPLYAAKMIEQGQPTLKNSLLNFLFLTQNQQGTRKAVLDAVESQAATDISSLSLEHLVDYSKAIRVGYVLAALAVLFGLYKVLSPKDPLQTAARVAMPWNDIARPSRVKIIDVQPGDTTVYQGEQLPVSVKLHDVGSGDRLELIYSTKDGQLVDKVIPLEVSEDGFSFQAIINPTDTGIQDDLTYRIEAGDAVSRDFEVSTLEAPSIDVASVRYDLPGYTGESGWDQEGDGHIRALEGTMVTIRAVSNRPIQKAYIEFDPVANSPIVSLNTLPMQIASEEPTRASIRFPLEMNDAGSAGKFRSYQIRFRTEDGVLNPHPVLYDIEVTRDLPPEIEFLEPTANEVELPVNMPLDVRLRAIDPDYGIRQLRVNGAVTKGPGQPAQPLINASLLQQPKSGQVLADWKLTPKEHGLKSGDIVRLTGIAEDTRTDYSGNLKPNISQTQSRIILITDPVTRPPGENQQPGNQDENQPKQEKPGDENQPGDSPEENQKGESGEEGENGEKSAGGSKEGENGEQSEENKGESGDEGKKGSEDGSGENGMRGPSDSPQDGENSGESDDKQQGKGGGSGDPSGDQEQQDQQQGKGNQSEDGNEQGDPQKGDAQPEQGGQGERNETGGDEQSESKQSGGTGGEASTGSDQQQRQQNKADQQGSPNGKGTGKAGDPNKGGQLQNGDASTQPNESSTVEKRDEPIASDGTQDGDAFDTIQDYLKKKQEQQAKGDQPKPDGLNQKNPQQQGEGESSGEPQAAPGENQNGAGGNSQKPEGGDPNKAQNQGQGTKGGEKPGEGEKPEQQPGENGVDNGTQPENSAAGEDAAGQEQKGQPGTQDNNQGEGMQRDTQNNEQGGSENKGGAKQKDAEGNPSEDSERANDNGQGDTTNSGAGKEAGEENTGSPQSGEKANKQSENKMKPDDQASDQQGDQPKSPSNSDKQSNSKGDNAGDQSGGGGAGGGQAAKQAGNDSPGSTSSADEGAGTSNQQGKGEVGNEGGEGPKANEQTGSQSNEKGEGSNMTNSPEGQQSGAQGSPSEDGSPQQSPSQKNDPQNSGQGPGNTSVPQGGSRTGNNEPQPYDGPLVEPGEDAANLEYAEKATNMVLDELQHQDNPDPELLKKLGWNKDEFQRFVQRWQQMKQAANSEDVQAKQELNDALRSLGLSRGKDATRRVEARQATSGGSSDTQRSAPPAAFMEQYRAYLKGASQ